MSSGTLTRLKSACLGALRICFRALPLREAARDRLRNRLFDRFPFLLPPLPQGQLPSGDRRPRPPLRTDRPAIGYRPRRTPSLPSPLPATLVAFYLPQFHPIPENDAWWGQGFTEWRNVARATPQFEGHGQPRIAGTLGEYDLRDPEVMRAQAALARTYGIGAFCFYFYWFAGKTLLETPVRQWRDDPDIELPYCLCWANENWSRRWDGRADQILIAQQHSPDDDLAFIAHVAEYLRDPRYLRVEGRPVLLIYRAGLFPDIAATAERWRRWCRDNGVGEIHLACVHSFERDDPRDIGFDAAVEFPPNLTTPGSITERQLLINPDYRGQVLDWREMARQIAGRPLPDYRLHPAVNCGWDNEPRRTGAGRVYLHASPRGYRDWLRTTIHARLAGRPVPERLVFINAWNEWAEGAVLEPDARLGHAWLDATRQALDPASASSAGPRTCVVIHAWYPDVLEDMLRRLQGTGHTWRYLLTVPGTRMDAVRQVVNTLGVDAEIVRVENRGRDMLPFLHLADRLLDEGVDVVLKLHTKRSTHRDDGDSWRNELLQRLAASDRIDPILQAFEDDPGLGLVAPEDHVQPLGFYWGANRDSVHYLAARIGIPTPDPEHDRFVAGSMFWLRLEALRPILDAHLGADEFEEELGQVDGTLAHALERVIATGAQAHGYRVDLAAHVCGQPATGVRRYRYARRH